MVKIMIVVAILLFLIGIALVFIDLFGSTVDKYNPFKLIPIGLVLTIVSTMIAIIIRALILIKVIV